MHQVTKMLEQNNYIRCLVIYFTKAFDIVNHVILLSKLIQLNIPTVIVKWICSFCLVADSNVQLMVYYQM